MLPRCGGVVVGAGVGVLVGVIGRRHKLVPGSRSPCRTRRLLCHMEQDLSLKVVVHPSLQSVLMEMSDECMRPGTMCTWVAAGERPGMCRLHVWVDLRMAPLGRVTEIGLSSC